MIFGNNVLYSCLIHFRKQNVYSLKEITRLSIRNFGPNVLRDVKLEHIDLGLPLTIRYFLDYDDFDFEETE